VPGRQQSEKMMIRKSYTISGNQSVLDLIENFDLTYTQARRYRMREDGMTFLEIAEAEGVTQGAVNFSIVYARRKLNEIKNSRSDVERA